MKKLLYLPLCLLLAGCGVLPAPREMEDMALFRTLGVDVGESGTVLTVSTGLRAEGTREAREGALMLTAQGDSLSQAALRLKEQSDSYVFLGCLDQLLLGEAQARTGIKPVLDFLARDEELSLGSQFWVVRGDEARGAVSSGGEQGVERRLNTLRQDSGLGTAAMTRTAGEVYADLLERGAAWAPALLRAEGQDSGLRQEGYGIFKRDRLCGFLTGGQARGLELLAGKPRRALLQGEDGLRAWLTRADTVCHLEEGPVLTVTCRAAAELAEYGTFPDEARQRRLCRKWEQEAENWMEAALERLQVWGADCAGLGPRAGLRAPGRWRDLRGDWGETFGQIEVRVEAHVDLRAR